VIGLPLLALIAVGQLADGFRLVDDQGAEHRLPDDKAPLLVVYEDKDGGKQNAQMKALIAAYHDPLPNRGKLPVWPIADLSRWNWWPARGKALASVQKSAADGHTRILIDWTGVLHKAWGLQKAKNSVVLIGPDHRVRFASEGETTQAQRDALETELKALGLSRAP
jgi:hypothetical protein